MSFEIDKISTIIKKHYGISGTAVKLPGELDLNYFIEAGDRKYIFKIASIKEILDNLLLQHAVINHLANQKFGLATSVIVKTVKVKRLFG
jgi:Ser/Thr protein kinase RdoA (MazF antagonist)